MKGFSPVICLQILLLAGLPLLPLRVGDGVNAGLPAIGAAEKISADHCRRTLERATAAYVSAKVVDKAISMIQRWKIPSLPWASA